MKERREHLIWTPKAGAHIETKKTGRNEPCPCGSGKKNKHCCKIDTKFYSVPNRGQKSIKK